MQSIDIEKALMKDDNYQKGLSVYSEIDQKANSVAEEISSSLVETIVKDSEKFNISTAMLSVAKSLSHLSSYLYDTEEEFLTDVKKARTAIVSDIIPALLAPEPCEVCEQCKNGNFMDCINPKIRADHTTSRFLPILANMLIEYDYFNKIVYMHTAGKDEHDEAAELDKEENK